MIEIVGKYQHYKSENVENYFAALGIPYLIRKIIAKSSPLLEIFKDDNDEWTIKVHTMIKTVVSQFKIGEDFEESMPFGGLLKSKATIVDGKLVINTLIIDSGIEMSRFYECVDQDIIIITMNYNDTITAKRYFKRID